MVYHNNKKYCLNFIPGCFGRLPGLIGTWRKRTLKQIQCVISSLAFGLYDSSFSSARGITFK